MKKLTFTLLAAFLLIPAFSFAQQINPTPTQSQTPLLDTLSPGINYSNPAAPTPVQNQTSGAPTNSGLNYTGSLVQCDGVASKNEPNRQKVCNFASLINTVKYLINWAFALTIPVMVGLLAWAGLLHMTGKEDYIKTSYKILQNAVIGFAITLCAWFIVTTVLKWVLDDAFKGAVETLVETQK